MKIYDYEVPADEMDFFKHFPLDISGEIQDYITNKAMDWSRYIFTHREGREQWGYCTHCKQEHPTDTTLKHGKKAICPHCNSGCHVKASGIGRSSLTDETYTLWYEKSVFDPNIVIARGFYAKRDYTKNYKETNTFYKVTSVYLFQPGGGTMMSRDYYDSYKQFIVRSKIWSEAKHSMKHKDCYHNKGSLKEAVRGTFLQYCTWEHYGDTDYLDIIDLASRYKCIEFITKVGCRSIVDAKLRGFGTYGAINWNGKTPQKILRLNMPQIKAMQKYGSVEARTLRSFQISQNDGSNLSWHEASILSDLVEKHHQKDIQGITRYLNFSEMKRYLAKQIRKSNENNRRVYSSGMSIVRDWNDYIRDCSKLAMDITNVNILFPRDLHAAHQETSSKIKYISDKKTTAQIKKRLEILQDFKFENNGLFLRPPSTADEIFTEGKILKHCVGGYAQRHAEGITNIFFLRDIAEPDKPFFTLELKIDKGGHGTIYKIIQCRGEDNCEMTPIVKSFLDAFHEKILIPLTKTKARSKRKNRVEVAI